MNISDDVDQSTFSPGDLMSISSKYFETLFEVLSTTTSSQLRNATWKFLMELPTSEDILKNIEAKTMDIKESIWKSFLIDGSIYRAIYCLQVIDSCLIPSEPELDGAVGLWRDGSCRQMDSITC